MLQNVFNHPGDLRSGDCKGYPTTEVVAYSSIRRVLRRALLGALACAVVAAPVVYSSNAYAKGDDDEDSEDSDSDSDSDSSDEDEDKGDGGDEEDEEEVDKDQPPVTAGGLYNINTYPVAELQRPLTMTQGILQMRAGLGVDVSAQTAFESVGHVLDFRYGVKDNFMLLGGFNSAYNFTGVEAFVGMEASLAYDLIDFRAAFRAGRDSSLDSTTDPMNPKRVGGGFRGHVDIGFPFRYVAKKEVAIVALDTLMTIDFDNKPDLNPSLGISTNPIPEVSIVIFAQMRIVDFNTDAANFIVPATARVQFSPTQRLDLGAEFRFDNVKPPEGQKFYDQRFLSFYGQARF